MARKKAAAKKKTAAKKRSTTTKRKATSKKKTSARKATSKKKATAKKKTSARKATSKKKAPAKKKAAAKKTTARKTAAKKSTAKKSAAKKAPTAKAAPVKAAATAKKVRKASAPKNSGTQSYTQSEFLENLRAFCGLEKRTQAKELWDDISAFITDSLKRGYRIPLSGLGKMYVRKSKARMGRNPATGEIIHIAAKKRVRFTAAKALKDSVL